MILLFVFLFFFGSAIGSFLNALIDRIPRGEIFTRGRSHCDSCNHTLRWYDLIPVFSFLFLRGKCRYCKKSIGFQALVMELLTGALFLATVWFIMYQNPPCSVFQGSCLYEVITSLLYTLFVFSCFLIITFIDA